MSDQIEENKPEIVEEQPIVPPIPQGKWYVLHSQTGHENRVKNNLEQRVHRLRSRNETTC